MMGSAFKAMDVVVACLSYEKGGGLEEGGLQIASGRRVADHFPVLGNSSFTCMGAHSGSFRAHFCIDFDDLFGHHFEEI